MHRYDLVIFDLDGVLIDSRDNMEASWRAVCEELGWNVPFAAYFSRIGLPFGAILDNLGLKDQQEEAAAVYAAASVERFDLIRVYAGISTMLARLRRAGLKTAIVTSKDARRTALIVDRLGFHFDAVQPPSRCLRGKPAPDQINVVLHELDVSPFRTLYVGDMAVDRQTAWNAHVSYVHAAWGYGAIPQGAIAACDPADLADIATSPELALASGSV